MIFITTPEDGNLHYNIFPQSILHNLLLTYGQIVKFPGILVECW